MTYQFLCKYFSGTLAAVLTVLWFSFLAIAMFALSVYGEDAFIYINF